MLRKVWWTLLVVFSLSGCKNGPVVSYCVVDAPNLMLRCSDPKQVPFDLTIAAADNYGCMSPDDWQVLLSWLKTDGKAKGIDPKAVYNALQHNPSVNARLGTKLSTFMASPSSQ